MNGVEAESVMHWTCPGCAMQWYDRGRGFPGMRWSMCVRCGTDAREAEDARPAERLYGPLRWAVRTDPAPETPTVRIFRADTVDSER